MLAQFDMLRDWIAFAQDKASLVRAFGKFAKAHGFDFFTYLCVHGSDVHGVSTYPETWQETYLSRSLANDDPVVKYVSAASNPSAWSAAAFVKTSTREQWQVMAEARAFGIRSGISIPVFAGHGRRAFLTFASGERTADISLISDRFAALTLAAYIDGRLQNLDEQQIMTSRPCPLTPVQRDCLAWLIQGKTSQDIAALRNVSRRAVEFQLHDIRRRLNAVTTYQAVALAVRQGWI